MGQERESVGSTSKAVAYSVPSSIGCELKGATCETEDTQKYQASYTLQYNVRGYWYKSSDQSVISNRDIVYFAEMKYLRQMRVVQVRRQAQAVAALCAMSTSRSSTPSKK
ncbi:unnamed protein product [Aphanomyces euteiches]